jgi:hypothetical protein
VLVIRCSGVLEELLYYVRAKKSYLNRVIRCDAASLRTDLLVSLSRSLTASIAFKFTACAVQT